MKSSLFTASVLSAIVFTSVPRAFAQARPSIEALALHRTVTRDIAPGSQHLFSLHLNPADYVDASITQQAGVGVVVYLPDNSVLRTFPAAVSDGKQSFAFAAEGGGHYKIELTAGNKPAHYELRIDAITGIDERLKGEPWTDPNPSPRIDALRQEIASGNRDTTAFWKEVATMGTPLVEPYGKDRKHQLVTFLWRATYETRSVFLRSPLQLPNLQVRDYAMRRLPDTDVWYLTLKIPAGARFDYTISPNDTLVFDARGSSQRDTTAQADPLNAHRWSCDARENSSRFSCHSYAELPGAAPGTWFIKKPGIAEGRIETKVLHSETQKLDRTIAIYMPPGYQTNGAPNRLLVAFDGDDYLDDDGMGLPATLNNLIAASKIPPILAVMVYNVHGRRLKDLLLNEEFAGSIARELVPWVREHYNVTSDASQTVVTGHSAGGVAAVFMGLRYPNVFGNVLSQSGAVWWSPEMNLASYDARDERTGWPDSSLPPQGQRHAFSWMREPSKEIPAEGAPAYSKPTASYGMY